MHGNTADEYDFRLSFDSRDPRQVRAASLVHACDVWNQVELVDVGGIQPDKLPAASTTAIQPAAPGGAQATGLQLVTRNGELLTGYFLFERLVRSLPLCWPVALATWIPGLANLALGRYPGTERAIQAPALPSPGPKGPRPVGAPASEQFQPRHRKRNGAGR
jgi:hypothetical protein